MNTQAELLPAISRKKSVLYSELIRYFHKYFFLLIALVGPVLIASAHPLDKPSTSDRLSEVDFVGRDLKVIVKSYSLLLVINCWYD